MGICWAFMTGPTLKDMESQLARARASGMLPHVQRMSHNEYVVNGAASQPLFNSELKPGSTADFFDNRMTVEQYVRTVESINHAVLLAMVGNKEQSRFKNLYDAAVDAAADATTTLRKEGCNVVVSVTKNGASSQRTGAESAFSLTFSTTINIVFDA